MVNKAIIVGRLGKDPEVRRFDNDSAVCNFSVATSETYKDRDGNRVESTEWHNISIWRPGLVKVAENYLRKGSLVFIEGKITTRSWDDKDGNKRYTTEIRVENLRMLDSKSDNSGGGDNSYSQPQQSSGGGGSYSNSGGSNVANDADIADDLPF